MLLRASRSPRRRVGRTFCAGVQECDKTLDMKGKDKGTYTVHATSHCEGAFATIKHSTEDDDSARDRSAFERSSMLSKHDNPLEGKNWTMVSCEGHYFSLSKVVPETGHDTAHARDSEPSLTELGVSLVLAEGRGRGNEGHDGHKCRKLRLQDALNGGVTGHLNVAACSGSNKVFASALSLALHCQSLPPWC